MSKDESMGDRIRATFRLATLQREAEQILTGDYWRESQKMKEGFQKERDREFKLYRTQYEARLETARKLLVDEAGKHNWDLVNKMFPADRFDRNRIERMAHREVEHHHRRRIAIIDRAETSSLENLLTRNSSEKDAREQVRQDFTKADRRENPERRISRTFKRQR